MAREGGLTWDEAQDLVRRYVDGGRHGLSWQRSEAHAGPEDGLAKLALNMVLCALAVLPSGGDIGVTIDSGGIAVSADGTVGDLTVMRPPATRRISFRPTFSPRDIQPYLTALFAADLAGRLTLEESGGDRLDIIYSED